MSILYRSLCCVIAIVFTIFSSSAGATNTAFTDWFEGGIPLVLSATRLKQPINESPVSVSIIDKAMIERIGAQSIPELLRYIPGMQVGYVRGNFPVVAYQGLTSEFPQGVQVLIDGMSVYSPLFGGVLWTTLPIELEDIERIEVVRGPNSASYGANSFQSVIHITTTHAAQDQGDQLNLRTGTNNQQRLYFRHAGRIDNLAVRISGNTEGSHGYKMLDDDFRKTHLNGRFDYQPNASDQFQLNLALLDTNRETADPSFTFINPFDPPRERKETSQYALLRWEHTASAQHSTLQQITYQRFHASDQYAAQIGPLTFPINAGGESNHWDIEFQHRYQPSENLRLIWGAGALYDQVYLPLRLNRNDTVSHHRERLFTHVEWRPEKQWLINLGLLGEHDELSGPIFSPRLGATYLFNPAHSVRFNITRAYRTPVLAEEYRETVVGGFLIQSSAGNLDPERVDTIETGYHGMFLHQRFNLDVKLFQNDYQRLINNSIDGLLLIDNQYEAKATGIEIEARYHNKQGTFFHFSYAGTRLQSDDARLRRSIPNHSFTALIAKQLTNNWQTSLAYHQLGSMQYLGNANVEQGPYKRLDWSVQKAFRLNDHQTLDFRLTTQWALDQNRDFHTQAYFDNRAFFEVGYRFD